MGGALLSRDEHRILHIDRVNCVRSLRCPLWTRSRDRVVDPMSLCRERALSNSTAATCFLVLSIPVWGATLVAEWLHKKQFGFLRHVISCAWAMSRARGHGWRRHDN